tara:strand:+ start:2101 stop:2397 length:297 start_codon:yes stop_codon:yes gene_type:complete
MEQYFCPLNAICPAHQRFIEVRESLIEAANESGNQAPEEAGTTQILGHEGTYACSSLSELNEDRRTLEEDYNLDPYINEGIGNPCIFLGLMGINPGGE